MTTHLINVKEMPYGAKGDGVTDDHMAIKRAVEQINLQQGGVLWFPPGVYRIAGLKQSAADNVKDIVFFDCRNLIIRGYGATIDVNGSFHRLDQGYASIIPFQFVRCQDFVLAGFELNGNVNHSTRARKSVDERDGYIDEGDGYGIITSECRNYILTDLDVHHFQTDGIYLGKDLKPTVHKHLADRNARLIHVKSRLNARNALTIAQLNEGEFICCEAVGSGFSDGQYGWHSHGAGVDIEPTRVFPQVDVNTGVLKFINCAFTENRGIQFQSSVMANNIHLMNCHLNAKPSNEEISFYMDGEQGYVERTFFDLGDSYIDATRSLSLDIIACEIHSNTSGITGHLNSGIVNVKNCKFVIDSTKVAKGNLQPYFLSPRGSFTGNYIFTPKEVYDINGAEIQQASVVQARYVSDNTYDTDLNLSGNKRYFVTDYCSAFRSTVVGDHYIAPSLGAFRPEPNYPQVHEMLNNVKLICP